MEIVWGFFAFGAVVAIAAVLALWLSISLLQRVRQLEDEVTDLRDDR